MEWLRLPVGFMEEIMEARAYAQAKQMTDAATTAEARKALPKTPLFWMVKEIEFALVHAELDHSPDGAEQV